MLCSDCGRALLRWENQAKELKLACEWCGALYPPVKFPGTLGEQVATALDTHNQLKRRDSPEEMLTYSYGLGSHTAARSQDIFLNYNTTDVFIITSFHSTVNWKRLEYRILSTDERATAFVTPIIEKFINDLEAYYNSSK